MDIIPCSRIGHVFRKRRPYGDPNGQDTMLYNSLRVAHVWMDDYKVNSLFSNDSGIEYKYIFCIIQEMTELYSCSLIAICSYISRSFRDQVDFLNRSKFFTVQTSYIISFFMILCALIKKRI